MDGEAGPPCEWRVVMITEDDLRCLLAQTLRAHDQIRDAQIVARIRAAQSRARPSLLARVRAAWVVLRGAP